jgi:putative transposase
MSYERKKQRLQDFDYSMNNFFFVTMCCQNREKYFGKIENGQIILNNFGLIVEKQWLWLEENYSYVFLDEYIIMPEHFHGILIINRADQYNPKQSLLERQKKERSRPFPTTGTTTGITTTDIKPAVIKIKPLPQLIGAFKTTTSKAIHLLEQGHFPDGERSKKDRSRPVPTTGGQHNEINTYFQWQKSYHDRIIRNERELNNVRQYIKNNPLNWENDIENSLIEINDKQRKNYYDKIL